MFETLKLSFSLFENGYFYTFDYTNIYHAFYVCFCENNSACAMSQLQTLVVYLL